MAKNNQNYVFSGEIWWSKVFEGQADSYDDGPEFYKLTMVLDDESWAKYRTSKLKLQARPVSSDEPDKMSITFRRAKDPKVGPDGNEFGGGVPRVLDADGNDWDTKKLIGNGSKGSILVNRYIPASKPSMVGHRLEAVKVLEHVPYEGNSDPFLKPWVNTDEEDKPEVEAKPVKKTKVVVKDDMDDSIPF